MRTDHKTLSLALLLPLLAFGCAVQLSPELQLTNFSKDPDTVNVTGAPGVVTCDMTIPDGAGGAGGGSPNVVKYAACSFKSPDGRKQGCLATSAVGDVWSCDVTIPADSEGSASPGTTWTIEHVFAESEDGAKLFATGAEIQADQLDGEVDLNVISDAADTTPPTITAWNSTSLDVYPGSLIQCRVQTNEDPVQIIGCTFLPDDASASVSCVSAPGVDTCTTTIPAGVSVGVVYNEVNHFARDAALNVTVADGDHTFTVVSPPTTGTIAVNMAALPAQCSGASWSISPGGLSGSTSNGGVSVAPGDYTITWNDTALGCTVPTSSPQLKTVTLGSTTTFNLTTAPSTNYTTRSTFAGVNVDVGVDGVYVDTCPGACPAGPWVIESDELPAQFSAFGIGDNTDVAPQQGNFYVGRNYTLTWGGVVDHATPAPSAITTSGTYQGNYIDQGADACAGFTIVPPDYTANGGWSATQTESTAAADLTIAFYARPSVANQNAIFAVAENDNIATFDDGSIQVRFNNSGEIDARNGGQYCSDSATCDNTIPYVPGEWYHIVINASVGTQIYTVQVETCDDGLVTLITDAAFRTGAGPAASLGFHAAWDQSGNNLDIDQVAWTPGVCTPTITCTGIPPYECGAPLDDCGDPLSCGDTCTGGDVCFPQGTCCPPNDFATVCTTPGRECGDWTDNCGGSINCGDNDCGDGAGGDYCQNGTCVTPGPSGEPYVHVNPSDVGVTLGVGVVAPIPTVVYTGTSTPAAGTLIENVIINGQEMTIKNPNITFRNVIFNCEGELYCIQQKGDDGSDCSGLTVEYSKLSAFDSDVKIFRGESATGGGPLQNYTNLTIRNNEISGGHDWGFWDGDIDGLLVEDNWFHTTAAAGGRHADGFQIGEFPELGDTQGTLIFRGNYFDKDTTFEAMNALLFMTGSQAGNNTTVYFENNHVGEWGWSTLWCEDADACIIRYNVWEDAMQTALPAPGLPSHAIWFDDGGANWGAPSEVTCERYEDGSFLQNTYIRGPDNTITGCPSYPP